MVPGKKYLLFILIIFLYLQESYSQEFFRGYIFSRKGDTISGFIKLPPPNRAAGVCVFKPRLRDNPVMMSAKEISGFGTGNTIYVSTLIHLPKADTLVFTRLLYDGTYDLMYFETFETKHFIILRPDSSVYGIKYPPEIKAADILAGITSDKRWKNQTESIFTDFPDLPEYEKGIKPEISSFINLFRQYHNNPSSALTRRLPAEVEEEPKRNVRINNKNREDYTGKFRAGFIINNLGDTINGLVGNQLKNSLFTSCFFTPEKNEEIIRFSTGDIAGFGNYKKNKVFTASSIPSTPRDTSAFVRLLFNGTVDLLFYELSGKKHFLLRDHANKVTGISFPPELNKEDYVSGLNATRKFEGQAESMFAGMGVTGDFKRLKPDARSIIAILENHHVAQAQPFNIYNGKERVLDIGPVAGVKFEKYIFDVPNEEYKSYSEPAPYAGISLRYFNRKSGNGVVFRNTFGYHNHHYSFLAKNPVSWNYMGGELRSLSNDSEAGLTISPLRRLSPGLFLEAGPMMSIYIKPQYTYYIDQVFKENNIVYSYYYQGRSRAPFYFGFYARTGLSLGLKNGKAMRVSGGYSYLSARAEQIHLIDFSAAYLFRFRQ